jgi:hypothetical protein
MASAETDVAVIAGGRGGSTAAASLAQARRRVALGLVVIVLASLGLAGCVTAPLPVADARGEGWQMREGQAVWQPRRTAPPIAGELLLITHENGDFILQFSKTPLTIATAQRSGARWQVDFPAQSRRYGGTGPGSRRLLWVLLPAALRNAPLPADVTFRRGDGTWRLASERTGERIEGFLSP